MTDSEAPTELERIIKAAEVELRQIHPGLFSPEGFQRLTECINEFIGELTVESVKVAKRHQSDSVSPAYVDQAKRTSDVGTTCKMAEGTRWIWWDRSRCWLDSGWRNVSIRPIFYSRIRSQYRLHRFRYAGFHVSHSERVNGFNALVPAHP